MIVLKQKVYIKKKHTHKITHERGCFSYDVELKEQQHNEYWIVKSKLVLLHTMNIEL